MKYCLYTLLCFFLAVSAHAQQLKFNPKAGINGSTVFPENEDYSNAGRASGYVIGAELRIGDYDNWFYWQPGAFLTVSRPGLYVNRGSSTISDDVAVQQLKIPLGGGMYLSGSDGIVRVRLSAGLVPTFVLGVGDSRHDPADAEFEDMGLGANVGLGLDIAFITLDANYEYGLTKIYQSGDGRMDILYLTVGVVIPPTF